MFSLLPCVQLSRLGSYLPIFNEFFNYLLFILLNYLLFLSQFFILILNFDLSLIFIQSNNRLFLEK